MWLIKMSRRISVSLEPDEHRRYGGHGRDTGKSRLSANDVGGDTIVNDRGHYGHRPGGGLTPGVYLLETNKVQPGVGAA